MDFSRYLTAASVLILATMLAACSAAKNEEYKNAKSLPPLEVPPDLINPPKDGTLAVPTPVVAPDVDVQRPTSGTAEAAPTSSSSPPPTATSTPGSTTEPIRLERDGGRRWLVVPGQVPAVSTRVREFLLQEGYEISKEDIERGALETEWRDTDAGRGDAKDKEKFSAALTGALQDKYRLRIEPGRVAGTVEVYVSHVGVQHAAVEGAEKWQLRPADLLLEAELLSRMQDYFANEAAHPEPSLDLPAARAEIDTSADSVTRMRIAEDFDRAWRRIGFALGRGGFVIEDRNRNEGLYLIRLGRAFKEDAKAGFLSRLFGSNAGDPEAQYRVSLKGRGNETVVVVQHPGGAPVRTRVGERILNRLKEKME